MDSGRWYSTIKNVINLVNWTLTIARFSIHEAAVNSRVNKEVTPIISLFGGIVKSIIRFQFKVCVERNAIFVSWSLVHWICICEIREQCHSI